MQKVAVGAAAAAAVFAAGGAVAATKLKSPKEENQAVLNDVANELGVTPQRLSNALKTALKNRVDEAVEDGRLTKPEADRIKTRIDANDVPFLGPGLRGGRGHFGRDHEFHHVHKLGAAAKYLGLSESALRRQLENGKTLAQVARDRDKSVEGLVDALLVEPKEQIEQDVDNGELTRAEADQFLAGMKQRITDLVNGRMPTPPGRFFRHFRGDRGGAAFLGPAPPPSF